MERATPSTQIKAKESLSPDIKRLKLDADGVSNDVCVFLVDPKIGPMVHVEGSRATVMCASPVLANLLRMGTPGAAIKINNVRPGIFKLLFEYIHKGVINSALDCYNLPDLLLAAHLYHMESLKTFCHVRLTSELSVSNVWPILQKLLELNLQSAAMLATPLLAKMTTECLQHESFLTSSPSCVKFLLEQEVLDLCEGQLLKFCQKWANNQRYPKQLFRKHLLGNLRLLTLTRMQLAKLPSAYLTTKELQEVWKFHFKIETDDKYFPKNLSLNTTPRQSLIGRPADERCEHFVTLISEDAYGAVKSDNFITKCSFSNTLVVKPKCTLHMTRFYFLPLIEEPTSPHVQKEDLQLKVVVNKNGNHLLTTSGAVSLYTSTELCLETSEMLFEGETTTFEFTFSSSASQMTFKNIPCENINACIKKSLNVDDFESLHVNEEEQKGPFVVGRLKYACA